VPGKQTPEVERQGAPRRAVACATKGVQRAGLACSVHRLVLAAARGVTATGGLNCGGSGRGSDAGAGWVASSSGSWSRSTMAAMASSATKKKGTSPRGLANVNARLLGSAMATGSGRRIATAAEQRGAAPCSVTRLKTQACSLRAGCSCGAKAAAPASRRVTALISSRQIGGKSALISRYTGAWPTNGHSQQRAFAQPGVSSMDQHGGRAATSQGQLRTGGGFKLSGGVQRRDWAPSGVLLEVSPGSCHATPPTEPRFIGELVGRARQADCRGAASSAAVAAPSVVTPRAAHPIDIDLSCMTVTPRRAQVQSSPRRGSGPGVPPASPLALQPLRSTSAAPGGSLRSRSSVGGPSNATWPRRASTARGTEGLTLVGASSAPAARPGPASREVAGRRSAEKTPQPRISVFEAPPSSRRATDIPAPRPPLASCEPRQTTASLVPFPSRRHARHLAEVAQGPGQMGLIREVKAPPGSRDESAYTRVSTSCVPAPSFPAYCRPVPDPSLRYCFSRYVRLGGSPNGTQRLGGGPCRRAPRSRPAPSCRPSLALPPTGRSSI